MRWLLWPLCGAFLLFGFSPAWAGEAVCPEVKFSMGHAIHDILVHQPDTTINKYTGPDAQAGIAIFNKLPKPSDAKGDTFYVMLNPQSNQGLLAIAQGDCMQVWGMWPNETVLGVGMAIEAAKKNSPAS